MNRITRRTFGTRLAAGAAAAAPFARTWAQGRTATVVIPFTPGGATDTFGRMYAQALGAEIGEPFVVENVGGAGGAIGMARVANAQLDGRTLLYTYGNLSLALPYEVKDAPQILRDFEPVLRTIVTQGLIVTAPGSSIRSFADLLGKAAAAPGKVTFADFGGELTLAHAMRAAGIDLMRVPYKGGVPGMVDVISGRVDLYAGSASQLVPQIRAGKLRVLATSAQERMAEFPDVPAVRELLPAFRAMNYQGVFVRKGTPAAAVDALYQRSLAAVNRPEYRQQAAVQFGAVRPLGPAEFRKFMEEDALDIAAVMKANGK